MQFNIKIMSDSSDDLKNLTKNSEDVLHNIHFEFTRDYNFEYADLLIIDLDLKDLDLEKIIHNHTYIIFLYSEDETLIQLENLNITFDRIQKPINITKLGNKINSYINMLNTNSFLLKEREISNILINNVLNPVFITDGTDILFANDCFKNLLGDRYINVLNSNHEKMLDIFECEEKFLSQKDDDWIINTLDRNIQVSITLNGKKNNFIMKNHYLSFNNTYMIILNDITHEINHEIQLNKLLYMDNLTKLPNRTRLIEQLQNETIHIKAIAILDINSFKEINDFFGHKVGDKILIEVGKLIENYLKDVKGSLHFYKFPSDTYCIVNSNLSAYDFEKLIISISETIYKKVFLIEQHEIDVKLTTGISFSEGNNKLITADIALKAAKKSHKDYLIFYDELDKFREYENNMLWTKKLKTAFANDQIEVFFQPLINNENLEVQKYECLVRMIDEEGKVVAPFFFLDISKKSNQYTKITKIVIEKSFKKFNDLPFEFSVNISYEDIEEPGFLDFIKEMLRKYDVSNKVVFEILEDESIRNYDLLINFVDEVKALGCKVAIDDFGSGYSNFEYLLRMNIDYLKIDASLIKNVATDENSYKITKTIIDFARNLNLKTIAEFVENEEIFNIVKDLGTDYSQGYYFSAPIAQPTLSHFKEKEKKAKN